MNLDYAVGKLDTPEDWAGLAEELGGKDQRLVLSIIRHLITTGTKSYLIEFSLHRPRLLC